MRHTGMALRSGFTLVEVVVVLAIIMVLYAIIAPIMISARIRSKEAVCASNMHQTWLALEMYKQDNSDYPLFPTKALVPAYITEPSILICPEEYRDLKLLDENQNPSEEGPLSSYLWACTPGPLRDAAFKARGEQIPGLICPVHAYISSGPPFYQIIRLNGGLDRVLVSQTNDRETSYDY